MYMGTKTKQSFKLKLKTTQSDKKSQKKNVKVTNKTKSKKPMKINKKKTAKKGGSIFTNFFGKKSSKEITFGDLIQYYSNIDNIPIHSITTPPKDILTKNKESSDSNIFENR